MLLLMFKFRNVGFNKGWKLIKDDLQTNHFIPLGICGMLPLTLVFIAVSLKNIYISFIHQINSSLYFHWLRSHSLTVSKWFSIHNLFTSTSSIAWEGFTLRQPHWPSFKKHLLYGFDRGSKLISMLVKQVLQLQQIFCRRALLTRSHHLKVRLAIVPFSFTPRPPCSSHCRQRSLRRSQKFAAT